MTDDLERQLGEMMHNRVADLPDSYDVAPATLKRARRRRATKLATLVTAMALVVLGTGAAVARGTRDEPDRVSTEAPTTTIVGSHDVPTVACPIAYNVTPDTPLPPPSTAPRAVVVPGVDALVSYAATTDDRYIVLGPKGWTCETEIAADGQSGMALSREQPADNPIPGAVTVMNDFLWHGGVGSTLACAASDDPSVTQYVEQNFPEARPCPQEGRTVTRLDEHTETFVDRDGTRGASWIVLPSSAGAEDGMVSVLTCRSTVGLTAADCNVIISDWISRVDS